MVRCRQKPPELEAVQWNKPGDHFLVEPYGFIPSHHNPLCDRCGRNLEKHGKLADYRRIAIIHHRVCPGDWILEDVFTGEVSYCSQLHFEQLFDMIPEAERVEV